MGLASGDTGQLDVKSSSNIVFVDDSDDGREIFPGETITASLDFPRDTDYFTIQLAKGQTVKIATESLNVDTVLNIDFHGSRENQSVFDSDSGGGLFGNDSEVIYEAPETGVYFVSVSNEALSSHGGYFLSVSEAAPGAVPVYIPPNPDLVETPFGTMFIYQSSDHDFSVQVPADWIESSELIGFDLQLFRPDGASILILEEDLVSLGGNSNTLDGYTDLVESVIVSQSPGSEIVSRKRIQTSQGDPANLLEISLFNGLVLGNRLVYVDESGIAFNVAYAYPSESFDAAKDFIEYCRRSAIMGHF